MHKLLKDYNEILELYHNESDRAAAILAAAFLEDCLGNYLKSILIKDPIVDEMFDNNGALSNLDSKYKMLFALGKLSRNNVNDIKYIKKIRNYFAHCPKGVTFETDKIKDWCSNIYFGEEFIKDDNDFINTTRGKYLLAIAGIIMEIYDNDSSVVDIFDENFS